MSNSFRRAVHNNNLAAKLLLTANSPQDIILKYNQLVEKIPDLKSDILRNRVYLSPMFLELLLVDKKEQLSALIEYIFANEYRPAIYLSIFENLARYLKDDEFKSGYQKLLKYHPNVLSYIKPHNALEYSIIFIENPNVLTILNNLDYDGFKYIKSKNLFDFYIKNCDSANNLVNSLKEDVFTKNLTILVETFDLLCNENNKNILDSFSQQFFKCIKKYDIDYEFVLNQVPFNIVKKEIQVKNRVELIKNLNFLELLNNDVESISIKSKLKL